MVRWNMGLFRIAQHGKLFLDLVDESVYPMPMQNLVSVFGPFQDLLPPYHPWSEYNLFQAQQKSPFSMSTHRLFRGLLCLLAKRYGHDWILFEQDVQAGSNVRDAVQTLQRAARPRSRMRAFESLPGKDVSDERWFYIHGMFTNQFVAALHGNYIATLFGKKVRVLYHKTSGWVMDVLDCVKERVLKCPILAADFVYEQLMMYANERPRRKLIILAHSEGNLVMSQVLRRFEISAPQHLSQIELYTFANCAHWMRQQGQKLDVVPYLEHFANLHDMVCKVGVLTKHAKEVGEVILDGPVFTRDAWGHLLNTHYLSALEQRTYRHQQGLIPRLYGYLQ